MGSIPKIRWSLPARTMRFCFAKLRHAAAAQTAAASSGCLEMAPGVSDSLVLPSGGQLPINGFNQYRNGSQVIVYTPAFGSSTNTNMWSAEMTVVGGVVTAIDDGSVTGHGNSPIPANGHEE